MTPSLSSIVVHSVEVVAGEMKRPQLCAKVKRIRDMELVVKFFILSNHNNNYYAVATYVKQELGLHTDSRSYYFVPAGCERIVL